MVKNTKLYKVYDIHTHAREMESQQLYPSKTENKK